MAYVAARNNAVSILHRVTDLEGSLVTASTTGFSATLYDEAQNSSPTLVTWSEPVTTGYLSITVTPDAVGNWLLQFTNPTTNSDGSTYDYYIQCVASGAGLTPSGTYLTTLANLKEQLEITTTASDTYLTNLIARATTMIESELGRNVVAASYTHDFDGGSQWLWLPQGPIQSVTSVQLLDWSSGSASVDDTIAASDYRVYGLESQGWKGPGAVRADCWTFTRGNRIWRVNYVAGWSTVPYDLEQLCLDVCVWLKNWRKDTGTNSRDVGAGAMTFRSYPELTEMIAARLAAYKDWRT